MGKLRRMQVPQCARWSFSAATVHIDTGLKCIGDILLCTAVRQNDHRAHNLSDWFSRRGDHFTRYSWRQRTDRPFARLVKVVGAT